MVIVQEHGSEQVTKLLQDLIELLICNTNRKIRPIFVIPHEKIREDVEDVVGYDESIVFITTPGQVISFSPFAVFDSIQC